MSKIGIVKTKLLKKLTESYSNKSKKEIKEILKTIIENKQFKEMYLFYEEMENKYIEDKETARLYVEGIETMLNSQSIDFNLSQFCEDLDKKLGVTDFDKNELYESLDQLLSRDTLANIEKKIVARKKLVEHLTTKKQSVSKENETYTLNEGLLYSVLANNFNVFYDNTLTEEQKKEFKNIMSLSNEDINTKTQELKESLTTQIENLLTESTDKEMKDKLSKVIEEVKNKQSSRLNYFRLIELKNGLA